MTPRTPRWGPATALAAFGLLLLPALTQAQAADGVPAITLEEALDRAIERHPQYAQTLAGVRNASSGRRSALGAFLPSLSASSGASVQSSNRFDPATQRAVEGSSDSYSAGLSAGFDVFEGGRRFFELDRVGAEMSAAEARRDDQRYAVILQTKTQFFQALRQAELLDVQAARVRRADESLQNVRRRVQLGAATRSDSLRARLELANARQAELQTGTQLRAARFALGRLVGEERPVSALPPGQLDPTPLALTDAEIFELATSGAPSVVAASADAGAARASVSSARSAYLPSFSVSSGYTWSNDAPAFADGLTSWNLRFSASYPLFNGFTREGNIDRAENSLRVARLQEDDSRLAALQEADAALANLRTSERALEIASESVIVASEDLRVIDQRYRVGVATILDLITSQVALEQAEADRVGARYDYLLARAQLEAILGREL